MQEMSQTGEDSRFARDVAAKPLAFKRWEV